MSLNGYTFAPLHLLRELFLSNNVLERCQRDAFVGLHALRALHMQGNELQAVPRDLFAPIMNGLNLLDISGNPMSASTRPLERAQCPSHARRQLIPGRLTSASSAVSFCELQPTHDCVSPGWRPWGNCSALCGVNGVRTRHPIIAALPTNGGKRCPRPQHEPCNRLPCPMLMRQMLIIIWAALVVTGIACARIVTHLGEHGAAVQQSEEATSLTISGQPQPNTGSTACPAVPPEHNEQHAARRWDRQDRDALLIAGQFQGKSRRSNLRQSGIDAPSLVTGQSVPVPHTHRVDAS